MQKAKDMSVDLSPIRLSISDQELAHFCIDRISQAESKWEEIDLSKRQEKLERYLKGDQVPRLPSYKFPYKENILWETHVRNKAIAVSRIPDIIVKPGTDSPYEDKLSNAITKVIERDFDKRTRKNILGKAYVQRPVYMYSVIKARWNPQLGENGNYEFINVNPKNVVLDPYCQTPNSDEMEFLAEKRSLSYQQIIAMFPKKRSEILETGGYRDDGSMDLTNFLTNRTEVWEIWFDYLDEKEDNQYEKVSGVLWMLDTLILEKIKNPYFDFKGEPHYFKLEKGKKKEISDEEFFEKMFGEVESDVTRDMTYHNFFSDPRKPYFIMTYQSWDLPVDMTTNYEQVLELQDNINIEGRQIHEMNARSRGKHVFNGQAIDKEDIESIDFTDYEVDIVVDGNVRESHNFISSPPAPAQLYNAKSIDRSIAFEMLALNATTRGTREPGEETLGAKQMMREQDFGVIDDMVDDTINQASEWMSEWTLQFIKLFYKKAHMIRVLGEKGSDVYMRITQDSVTDGMEIVVGASATDKMQARREAYERARMGLTDPLTFFEDTETVNPEERTLRLMLFQSSPEMYIQKYLKNKDTQGMVAQLQAANQAKQQAANPTSSPEANQMNFGGGMPNPNRVNAQPNTQNRSWFDNFRYLQKNNSLK